MTLEESEMKLFSVNDRVKFGHGGRLTGYVVGHCAVVSPGGQTELTYAMLLDKKFQGNLESAKSSISTILVCAEGVELIK